VREYWSLKAHEMELSVIFAVALLYIKEKLIPKLYKLCSPFEVPFFRAMGYYKDDEKK